MSWAETLAAVPAVGERRTTAGFVADALRAAIRTGQLADGAELNQVALAEHFGVSRVPVREALRALEAEGWITARAHRRAFVQALSPTRIAEIFEVRALLEVHLLEKAIAHIDASRAARLSELCDAMDAMTDHHAWVAANREFHAQLRANADAPLTVELVDHLGSQVERYLRASAGAQMRAHIVRTRRHVLAAITATQPEVS